MSGRSCLDLLGELASARTGHDEVTEKEVDRAADFIGQSKCLIGAVGGEDVIARAAQDVGDDPLNVWVVLDEEDRLAGALGDACDPLRGLRFEGGCLLGEWKEDLEGRPLAHLAVHPDRAAALHDDPVHGREPEPGSLCPWW